MLSSSSTKCVILKGRTTNGGSRKGPRAIACGRSFGIHETNRGLTSRKIRRVSNFSWHEEAKERDTS